MALAALLLAAGGPPAGAQEEWSGDGPFPPGAGSSTFQAFAVDAATGTIYGGTGSGTVFSLHDASLSRSPEAMDDSAVTNRDVAIDIDVLANDSDPEGALDNSSVELQSDPDNGTATVNGDGTVTYTPDAGFIGTDGFDYTVRDQAGNESAEATVGVRVNAPPAAGDDAAVTLQDTAVTIDVLANDTDPDGTVDPASVAMWDSPANGGTMVQPDGSVTYTPDNGFSGTDTFTYTVADDAGAVSEPATVTVTVTEVNEPSPPGGGGGGGGGAFGWLIAVMLIVASARTRIARTWRLPPPGQAA